MSDKPEHVSKFIYAWKLYQAERLPPPLFYVHLGHSSDGNMYYEWSAEIKKSKGEKWSFFQLTQIGYRLLFRRPKYSSYWEANEIISSLMNWHSRTEDLLHLKTYFAVKIIPSSLQYLVAVFGGSVLIFEKESTN